MFLLKNYKNHHSSNESKTKARSKFSYFGALLSFATFFRFFASSFVYLNSWYRVSVKESEKSTHKYQFKALRAEILRNILIAKELENEKQLEAASDEKLDIPAEILA